MAATNLSFCSCCGLYFDKGSKRRNLQTEKTKIIVPILEQLIDLKLKNTECSVNKLVLLQGFVCCKCFKVLKTHHDKQKDLLDGLSVVFEVLAQTLADKGCSSINTENLIRKRTRKQPISHKRSRTATTVSPEQETNSPDVMASYCLTIIT